MRAAFHPLRVASLEPLTDDAVAITFDVPTELRPQYAFRAGQHLNLRCEGAGDDVRRSYSICSPAVGVSGVSGTPEAPARLRIGVKRLPGGAFSTYAAERMQVGDTVDVMTPSGSFTLPFSAEQSKHYCAVAAGSGVSPILSLVATALDAEPASRVTLVYGNRTTRSIMFAEELCDLKDRYLERFQLVHVLSREQLPAALLNGRIDEAKLEALFGTLIAPETVDEWLLCGPAEMTERVRATLLGRGVDPMHIHRELFHLNRGAPAAAAPAAPAAGMRSRSTEVTILLDGRGSTFPLDAAGASILDAALDVRADTPYACKNGMCGTCRAKVTEGTVDMDHNDALEPDEVAAGFVLACQAHPRSERVTLDFDT
ncbi:MAG: 1,2-phenylacetyl-CoA epoxidase subunit PaaE [Acidimicrobiia bacterium]